MLYLTRLGTTASYPVDILPSLLAGVGLGLLFPTIINGATLGGPRDEVGVASATVNVSQQVGGSIGTALLSTIAASATTAFLASGHGPDEAAVHGYTTAFAWSAASFVAGAVVAAFLFGRPRATVSADAAPGAAGI